jgi:hypothetical protein
VASANKLRKVYGELGWSRRSASLEVTAVIMPDENIVHKTSTYLASCLKAQADESSDAIAQSLTAALLAKHGDSNAEFRNEARSLGLSIKRDAPALRKGLLDGSISSSQAVNETAKYLDPAFKKEVEAMVLQNLKDSIAIDELEPRPGRKFASAVVLFVT